ncbi:MAG: aldehyde dehydrogenase [Candidatus Merdivicinus sp.]
MSGKTRSYAFRKRQLERLLVLLNDWESRLLEALSQDLGKCAFEAYATEIGMLKGEIHEALRHLKRWMAPRKIAGPMLQFPSHGWRFPEPKGCVLIVSPWNYPVQLTLAPLISAIAAGNCAILSLPPDAPKTSDILAKMIQDGFTETYLAARIGTIPCNTILFSLPFDHIFFTGSPRVGKIVMAAAASNLTPVTLELGGKSPCIIRKDADLKLAARRIVWGKCLNAGQTCVAPDYLLLEKGIREKFLYEIGQAVQRMFGDNMITNPEYAKIVNEKHFTRLSSMLKDQKILFGGNIGAESRKIGLTVVDNPPLDSTLMQEEIFGPILPLIEIENIEEAIRFVSQRPKPLACYVFSQNLREARRLMQNLSYGGGCINDTIVHLTSSKLPFGGIGNSGMGSCHGKAGFDTFTHCKSVLERGTWLDLSMRYPPYGSRFDSLKKLMR